MHKMMQNNVRKIRNIFVTCCILHNLINTFNEYIASPLYEIDPDVDEDLFMRWDEEKHPTWSEYQKTWYSEDPKGILERFDVKKYLNSDLLPHPIVEAIPVNEESIRCSPRLLESPQQ